MTDGPAKRRIGVLGGMGPEATVLFMSRVIALTPAADDSDHVPLIVDNNTQVPSRIKALIEKTGDDPGPVLADMARRLQTAGAQALAMPCNTAHHFAPAIVGAVDIPLLNMVDLAVERVAPMARTSRRVGLLASPAVQSTGLFDRAFAEREIATRYPNDTDGLLSAIRAIKIDSKDPAAVRTLRNAADDLAGKDVTVLVIACSEFSIIAEAIEAPLQTVDTIDVLAEAVIAFASHDLQSSGGNWRMSA